MLTILKLMASKNLSSSMCVFCVTERVCVCVTLLFIFCLWSMVLHDNFSVLDLCAYTIYTLVATILLLYFILFLFIHHLLDVLVRLMWIICECVSHALSLHACAVLASPNSVFNRSFLFFLFCCCFHFDWFCYRIFGIQSILRFELFFVSPSSRSLTRFLQAFSV